MGTANESNTFETKSKLSPLEDNFSVPVFLPEGIGPHEGRELDMMLAGLKPLAMLFDILPSTSFLRFEEFSPYISNGEIIFRKEVYAPPMNDIASAMHVVYSYYALPGEEWRIEAMHSIQRSINQDGSGIDEERERKIGYLLGYEDWQVDTYLAWLKERCGRPSE